ncbi:MAG: DUF192 domain-containing protein [Chloroflexota bacterium]
MLSVQNITRDVALITQGRVADNRWTRLKGLIGTKRLPEGDGLLIKPCSGVHCMFMSIPIDVLYMDKDDCVLDMDLDMQPNAIGRPRRKSKYVIELPAGTIERTQTNVGDRLAVAY